MTEINIIGISGRTESGKDTVSSMIQNLTYISFRDGKKPTFEDWDNDAWKYLLQKESEWKIQKFAYKVKQIASILTGIPIENFEDHEFKKSLLDDCWAIENNNVLNSIEPFKDIKFSQLLTVRDFLQKLGTDAIRYNLHPNTWVNALWADYDPLIITHKTSSFRISKEHDDNIEHVSRGVDAEYPKWVISDVRFKNEADSIKSRGGIVVRLTKNSFVKAKHKSETELDKYDFDYIINNEHQSLQDTYIEVKMMLEHFKIIY